ncbi:MAG: FkbM family methyltransferase, partial [Pseudomonadota bacterium]
MRDYGYRQTMHSFEPLPDALAQLEKEAADDPDWHVHSFALGKADERRRFHIGMNDQTSSLKPAVKDMRHHIDAMVVAKEIDVDVRRLDDVAAGLGVDLARSFMKLDVQGAELDVIEGLGSRMVEVPLIQMETAIVPAYQEETRLTTMLDWFAEGGWHVIGIRPGFFEPRT